MKTFITLLGCMFLFASCEDFLKKDIQIPMADTAPKLVVTSALEDSLFYVYVSLSTPINSQISLSSQRIDEALIELFDGEDQILEITQRDKYPESEWGNSYYINTPFALRTDIKVVPGQTYTLKVSVEGYPPVSSTVTAPSSVLAYGAQTWLDQSVDKTENIAFVDQDYFGSCPSFVPISFRIKDDSGEKDYYMLEAFEVANENTSIANLYLNSQRFLLATSDRTLVQDNPDIVADQWLSETDINTFAFGQMIVSDLSFQGQEKAFNLLMSSCLLHYEKRNDCERLHQYYPDRVYTIHYKLYATIRHLNEESYHYYRTFALQRIGLDFFSEPVSLISNIEGGYGCFAVCTTSKVLLAEYDVCYVHYY